MRTARERRPYNNKGEGYAIFLHPRLPRPAALLCARLGPLPANFSRTREVWETAKKKVTGLSPRLLLQEQAFELAGRPAEDRLLILHAGRHDERTLRRRLFLFLERQRTRHIVILALEAVLVPVTGLMAVLPGPNIIFYALAIIMIIQWQALRGIGRTLRRNYDLGCDPLLREWEAAVEARDESRYPELLDRLEKETACRPPQAPLEVKKGSNLNSYNFLLSLPDPERKL